MITLQKHEISATIKDRYANIIYCFHFENMNENYSNELKLEMTIDPNAFISKFTADIDGELFIGETKERKTASNEYIFAKQKNENAILIDQPHKDIPNLFRIKTNINGNSKVILTVEIEQYLQKMFNFNQLNIQILRNFSECNIKENMDHIAFDFIVEDISGIYDINIPMINDSNIIIEQQKMDKLNQKYQITGKIICKLSKNNISDDVEWRKKLQTNDKLDVSDRGVWYSSEVVEVAPEQIKIHYVGFSAEYDEYININSDRLAKYNTQIITTNTKINELTLKYKVKGESNESYISFDNKSNTFCHVISDVITDSVIMKSIHNEGQNNNILIPRRVILVIDKSGSMGGVKWINTIKSTILAIKQLRNGYDRFGIILFNNNIKMLPDKYECILANDQNINECVEALQNENVGGGTDINTALLKAIEIIKNDILLLNKDTKNFFMNQIMFITDGEPQSGETNTKNILSNVKNVNDLSKIDKYNDKICIFSFGVGIDTNDSQWTKGLNHSFLKLLSVNNNGFYHRIKQSSADTELKQYFNILSKPILSNINIKYENKNIKDLTNTKFNTLYCGNDLIICGKIDTKQNVNDYNLTVTISALTGTKIKQDNKSVIKPIKITKKLKIDINSEIKKSNEKNINAIERICAYLKLKQFIANKLIHNDMIEIDDDEKKEDELLPLSLALKYHFISPWTSMIVVKKKQSVKECSKTSNNNNNQLPVSTILPVPLMKNSTPPITPNSPMHNLNQLHFVPYSIQQTAHYRSQSIVQTQQSQPLDFYIPSSSIIPPSTVQALPPTIDPSLFVPLTPPGSELSFRQTGTAAPIFKIPVNESNIATTSVPSNPLLVNAIDRITVIENIGDIPKVGLGKPKKSNPHNVSKHIVNKLHEVISIWYSNTTGKNTASKLTGMFLQNHDENKVKKYLSRQDKLKKKIDTFAKLLSYSEQYGLAASQPHQSSVEEMNDFIDTQLVKISKRGKENQTIIIIDQLLSIFDEQEMNGKCFNDFTVSNMIYLVSKIFLNQIVLNQLNDSDKETIYKYFADNTVDGKQFNFLVKNNEFIKNVMNYIRENKCNQNGISDKLLSMLQTAIWDIIH